MTMIVGVHGIAQQIRGSYELQQEWFNSLRDGLEAADAPELAASLNADDLKVSYYGRLFREVPNALGDDFPPASARDLRSEAELEFVVELYQAAVEQQPALGPPPNALGPGGDLLKSLGSTRHVQQMLKAILASDTFAGKISERAFIGNLKQVYKFMHDTTIKDEILGEVHKQVTPGTKIMIGHSLGSVVAYEYLCRYAPDSVDTFITVGSPLGIPNVVFDKLVPAPDHQGRGAWPSKIHSWVNVADPRDIVAMRKDLGPLFPAPGDGEGISDRLVNNMGKAHDIKPYLNSTATGSAIAARLLS